MNGQPDANETPMLSAWSDIVLGVLTKPVVSFKELGGQLHGNQSTVGKKLATGSFNLVFLVSLILALSRINADDSLDAIIIVLATLTSVMISWMFLSGVLALIAPILSERAVSWERSLALTGWAFTPLMFFAPLVCFKVLLGPLVFPFATILIWWIGFLLFLSAKTVLGVSGKKVLVVAVVLPPMLFAIGAFWIGTAIFVCLSEVISAFS